MQATVKQYCHIHKVGINSEGTAYYGYNQTMSVFPKKLKELIEEKSVDIKVFAEYIGLMDTSPVYKWLKDEISLLLPTAVKIAEFFDCSLDYLFGRSDNYGSGGFENVPPFDTQLRKVLAEQKISQYRLLMDKAASRGNLNSWLGKKQTPHIESIIKLADYLKISMDYLVGRER